MKNLGAVEAANEIRNDVFNTPGMDPNEIHQVRFVQSVCHHLGLNDDPENMHKVAVALHNHDIGMNVGQEYPKYAVRGHDKAQKVVQSEDEAHAWENEEPPPPPEPVGRIIEEPVQGQGVDNQDRVPKVVPPEHLAGRAPDSLTNVHATQTVQSAGSDNEAAHDHNPGSAEIHEEEIGTDDGEVHVEDPTPPTPSRKSRPK